MENAGDSCFLFTLRLYPQLINYGKDWFPDLCGVQKETHGIPEFLGR
jgi:hypothetical protein